jgi:hypothetical protein
MRSRPSGSALAALVAVSLLLAAPACKRRASHDRSSPEATLAAFFTTLNAGGLPADLEMFVIEDGELASWRLRCQSPGCKSGAYRIVSPGDRDEWKAVLYVDYAVDGEDGVRAIKGERSPISFEREGQTWYITQFGRKVSPARDRPAEFDAGVTGDAG